MSVSYPTQSVAWDTLEDLPDVPQKQAAATAGIDVSQVTDIASSILWGNTANDAPELVAACPTAVQLQRAASATAQYMATAQVMLQQAYHELCEQVRLAATERDAAMQAAEQAEAEAEQAEQTVADNAAQIEALHAIVMSMRPDIAAALRVRDDGTLMVRSSAWEGRRTHAAHECRHGQRRHHRRRRTTRRTNGQLTQQTVVLGPAEHTHSFGQVVEPVDSPVPSDTQRDHAGLHVAAVSMAPSAAGSTAGPAEMQQRGVFSAAVSEATPRETPAGSLHGSPSRAAPARGVGIALDSSAVRLADDPTMSFRLLHPSKVPPR